MLQHISSHLLISFINQKVVILSKFSEAYISNVFFLKQVSAFGSNDHSDEGDVWLVQWDKGGSAWQRDQKVSKEASAY